MIGSSEVRGWRAMPPALAIALAAQALLAVFHFVAWMCEPSWHTFEKIALVERGAEIATSLLVFVGCLQLAARLPGREARGARIAAGALLASVVLAVLVPWYYALHRVSEPGWFDRATNYTYLALEVVTVAGLALAGARRRGLASAAAALAVLHAAVWFAGDKLVSWFDLGRRGWEVFWLGFSATQVIALALAALAASRAVSTPEPLRATAGLARAGGALRLRVIAALVGSGIGLLIGLTSGGEGSIGLIKLATFSGLLIGIAADLVLAFGVVDAARAELPDLPRWPLVIAGGLVAWCAGVLLVRSSSVYAVLYGDHEREGGLEVLTQFAVALPVVETIGIAIVAATISALAHRRGLPDLQMQASGKGIGFVALMLAGIGISVWVVPAAKSASGLLVMLFCSLGAILGAMILMAQLCRLASEAIGREPGLPSAKIVS